MGPLQGLRVVEFAGIGPGPFCALMLADMGADVIRIDRIPSPNGQDETFRVERDVLTRGRRSIALDLKKPGAISVILRLIEDADVLIEGFRPGVMERLGVGPDVCLERNPRLVYGRMTGWGQEGPLKMAAGHDINYIAITGVLHAIGRAEGGPVPPLNLVGDFGGGGMLLAFGIVCALLETRLSGKGQVVDAAMTDGSALLMLPFYGLKAKGMWLDQREVNLLDGGAHFYNTYECADGKWVAVGSIEPQFYSLLLKACSVDDPDFENQMDPRRWPALKEKLATVFRRKTRAEWISILEGTDACFSPVLSLGESPEHSHNQSRSTFVEIDGILQPAPAPRFSRTPPEAGRPPIVPGEHTQEVLIESGFSESEISALRTVGAI